MRATRACSAHCKLCIAWPHVHLCQSALNRTRTSAGLNHKYVTYAVTSQSSSPALRIPSGTTVRRRFSDFVLLERLLRRTRRGHFIPPRPLKHVGKLSGKLRDSFVEKRRHSLELYLQRLASHRCAGALVVTQFLPNSTQFSDGDTRLLAISIAGDLAFCMLPCAS